MRIDTKWFDFFLYILIHDSWFMRRISPYRITTKNSGIMELFIAFPSGSRRSFRSYTLCVVRNLAGNQCLDRFSYDLDVMFEQIYFGRLASVIYVCQKYIKPNNAGASNFFGTQTWLEIVATDGFWLFLLRIVTGRQHQIRSHFAHVGHPTVHVSWLHKSLHCQAAMGSLVTLYPPVYPVWVGS